MNDHSWKFDDDGDPSTLATTLESTELKRVFRQLASRSQKQAVAQRLAKLEERLARCSKQEGKDGDGEEEQKSAAAGSDAGSTASSLDDPAALARRVASATRELEAVRRAAHDLDSAKITRDDLFAAMHDMKLSPSRRECEEMIWEVDDDQDGKVSYKEFNNMLERNLQDTTGFEPSDLYNFAQFLMYDRDCSGTINMNECVDLLYARYGRGKLQQQLQLMFGSTNDWRNQAHEITFREYLKIVAVGLQQKVENARKIKAVRRNKWRAKKKAQKKNPGEKQRIGKLFASR